VSVAPVDVVLVHPEIAPNAGSVGRTCLGFGARLHLVEPLGFELDDRRVRRAGLDYWRQVDLTVWPTWARLERELLCERRALAFTAEGKTPIWEADLTGPVALLFGAETRGLPRALRARDDIETVRVPMDASVVRSFNLATTVGMVLLEAARQRA
jgi:tRNA (cytidine/uridine-2'-O-)-methyltransferase